MVKMKLRIKINTKVKIKLKKKWMIFAVVRRRFFDFCNNKAE